MSNGSSVPGTPDRPLRVAVVGSGPSGFYAVAALMAAKDLTVEVDLFDRLPTPFGLVRGGVAPDHQKIKSVIRAYNKTAALPGFRFFGNVKIGADISVDELREQYDQVCFAVGCEGSRKLGIPGEDLHGSFSATEFVGWYNAHPDYVNHEFDLGAKAAVVVGVGNVSMDVTRVLAQDPERLQPSDIADHALDALRAKGITDVYVLGRRGPAQAAFSPAEIKEIGELEDVDLILPERSHVLDEASAADYEANADKGTRKIVEYLQEVAAAGPAGAPMRVHLLLCTSPVEVLGEGGKMTGVRVEINELYASDRGIRPRGTGETFEISAGLMFRSVGYKGRPLAGLPTDEWDGTIVNEAGRVMQGDTPMPGVYVVGWAKRGPSGLIGTNRADSVATVAGMLEDVAGLADAPARSAAAVDSWLQERCPGFTTWADWEALDAAEVAKGEADGRVRVKFSTVESMLKALGR